MGENILIKNIALWSGVLFFLWVCFLKLYERKTSDELGLVNPWATIIGTTGSIEVHVKLCIMFMAGESAFYLKNYSTFGKFKNLEISCKLNNIPYMKCDHILRHTGQIPRKTHTTIEQSRVYSKSGRCIMRFCWLVILQFSMPSISDTVTCREHALQ